VLRHLISIVGVISLPVIALGLVYFASITVFGARQFSRARREAGFKRKDWDRRPPPDLETASKFHVYFIVPCLNEEAVIGETVAALLAQSPHASVVVVDDASDDRTPMLARAAIGGRGLVVTRTLPEARQGKGRALNVAYQAIAEDARRRGLDPMRTLVCVMDADGRLSPETLGYVCPLFEDEELGAVQLPVRIRNRGSWLTMIQDYEFWALSATYQQARTLTKTVSLGGNGQFTRLAALREVGDSPWSDSLTEDLDLAVSLGIRGWGMSTTAWAYVSQEGVENWRRLVRQRTRWMQGHMTCAKRVPEVWRSPIGHARAFELTSYLLVPYFTVLPWSIIFPAAVAYTVLFVSDPPVSLTVMGSAGMGRAALLLMFYVVSFLPNIAFGFIYYSRDRTVGRLKALALTHSLVVANGVAYLATWRALGRMFAGRRGWAKTARHGPVPELVTLPPWLVPVGLGLRPVLAPVRLSLAALRPVELLAPRRMRPVDDVLTRGR
jgi:1,2-diacylglycerol 3-beta-glucosyltransferase